MINKLRRKFVFVNMLLVSVVLIAVFVVLCVSTALQQNKACHQTLQKALFMENDSFMPHLEFGRGGKTFQPDADYRLSTFCVLLDQEGSISGLQGANVAVSDDDIDSAVAAALESGREEGVISTLALAFLVHEDSLGTRIAFADVSSLSNNLIRLIARCALIGLGSLAAFFGISMFLAKWALRPVERAWSQQRQFIADASHELKTPLTVILANADILLSHPEDTIADQMKWIDYIKAEGEHMKKLVGDMLFLAKSDAQNGAVAKLPFSLSDAVLSAFLPFESVAFERKLELDSGIAPGIDFCGDEGQIGQLVMILLDNACKYTPEGGRVFLSLERTRDKIILKVSNTGEGIEQAHLGALFDRFYRVDKARSREAGGYGLGLSIAKRICENHGGKISVESGEGKGAVFTVTLPAR